MAKDGDRTVSLAMDRKTVTKIHPTALVDADAQLGENVVVGPFAIIEGGVKIGDGCEIAARSTLKSGVELAENNRIGDGSVIGGAPQHLSASGSGSVRIGPNNVFRENCTVHRALEEATVIGRDNYFMVNAHVAHDVVLGDECIIANNVMLGGHVVVKDQAYISGGVAVHQFCYIGREVMIGGQARVTRDVPPFVMICGDTSRVVGLNLVGLRRRGRDSATVKSLKAAYRLIYRSNLDWKEIVAALEADHTEGLAAAYVEFFANSQRGYVPERRSSRPTTLKVFPADGDKGKTRRAG